MFSDQKEISKVSQNLSLRLSPERKYKYYSCSTCCCYPCRCCRVCHFSPCRCCHICHCLPCKCFLHFSPVRCCSPCHVSPRPCSPRSTMMKSTNAATYNSPTKTKINYNAYEEGQFNDFLRKLMLVEGEIENAKIELALNPDFNCEDAFRIFELNGRGFLNACDLKCGLNLIGVIPTDQEVRLLMKRFDLLKEGSINYADFFDMVVPFEKDYRNMVENRLPNSCCDCRCPEVFCPGTICALRKLFNLIINFENEINNMRKLFGTLRLKINDIFGLLDCIRKGYFTNSDLLVYLKNKCLLGLNKNADLLFIRLDKERCGKIYLREIEDELQTLY